MMSDNSLEIGDLVGGRWRIDRYIASGGFGQVFAATDASSAAIGAVAVKVLLEGASTAERRNFLSEVRHMAALTHPNLVAHIDSGLLQETEQGAVFLVTELCDESLHDYCARQPGGLLPAERLPGLVAHVGAGLDHLHRSGRVHRDLKPANILRSGQYWKLADFGLVRDLSSSGVYHLNTVAGTPRFMAPEFFQGGLVGPEADVWSMGIVIHEAVSGLAVHGGEGAAFIHNVTASQPTISPSLEPRVSELVRRCLVADPQRRPAADDLAPILAGQAVAAPTVEPTESNGRPGPGDGLINGAGLNDGTGSAQSAGQAESTGLMGSAAPAVSATPRGAAPTGTLAEGLVSGERAEGGIDSGKRSLLLGVLVGAFMLAAGIGAWVSFFGDDDEGEGRLASDVFAPATDSNDLADGTDDSAAGDGGDGAADDSAAGDATDAADGEDATGTGASDSAADDARIGQELAFDEFLVGDCLDPDIIDGRLLPRVIRACDAPHNYEVIGLLEHPETGGEYPGDESLFDFGSAQCREVFKDRFGIDEVETSLQVVAFRPNSEDWDNDLFNVICVVNQSDLEPLSEPLGEDAAKWIWASGDELNFLELQVGRCFDPINEFDSNGLIRVRVVYRDCDEPHAGEHFRSVILVDLEAGEEGGYPDADLLRAEAEERCHDDLHEEYGDDFRFGSEAVVPTEEEWTRFGAKLAACVVISDEPLSESLASLAGN